MITVHLTLYEHAINRDHGRGAARPGGRGAARGG
jgi:hypothetical protein